MLRIGILKLVLARQTVIRTKVLGSTRKASSRYSRQLTKPIPDLHLSLTAKINITDTDQRNFRLINHK